MKLVVAGASGFVGTEIVRRSLSIPKITSVIALARRPVSAPSSLGSDADASKLHSVVIDDYGIYPDDVKAQLRGADACIWTVAITPSQARKVDFDQVRRVCHDYALIGLETIFATYKEGRSRDARPFLFLYMSGHASERDQNKTPRWEPRYCLMRGETENRVLAFAAEHQGEVEVSVAKPGLIIASGQYLKTLFAFIMRYAMSLPSVDVKECSAAMLHEVIEGLAKDPLTNDDLVRIGRQALDNA